MNGEMNNAYFKGLCRRDYIEKTYDLIREEGLEAVTIRRIAKELGCSSATLYRHFENLSEMLYYAELRTLRSYINRLNYAEKYWNNVWDIYIGVWDCYSREAFSHPEAYELLFFKFDNLKLQSSTREYYDMFPEDINQTNQFFYEMLQTADFFGRDYEMCKKCLDAGAITQENAKRLNRISCLLFKGYFKNVIDERIRDQEEIDRQVELYIDDLDMVVRSLALDLKGYNGYQEVRARTPKYKEKEVK